MFSLTKGPNFSVLFLKRGILQLWRFHQSSLNREYIFNIVNQPQSCNNLTRTKAIIFSVLLKHSDKKSCQQTIFILKGILCALIIWSVVQIPSYLLVLYVLGTQSIRFDLRIACNSVAVGKFEQ